MLKGKKFDAFTLHIECSVKSVAAWDVSKKEDGTAAQAQQ